MNAIRLAIVGLGKIARDRHIPAIAVSVAHKGRGFRFEHAAKFAHALRARFIYRKSQNSVIHLP